MSTNQEVREFFRAHLGKKVSNADLREALSTDDAAGISQALNVMPNNKEISREKNSVTGAGFVYWMGAAAKSEARTVKGKDAVDDDEVTAPTERKKRGPKPKSGPKQSRVARAKPEKKARKKKAKRAPKVTPPQPHVEAIRIAAEPVARAASLDTPASIVAVFGIRHDGKLVIDHEGQIVALTKPEVQRLQGFLNTVSPLWS